jgi:hypothetical protein
MKKDHSHERGSQNYQDDQSGVDLSEVGVDLEEDNDF